MTDFTPVMEKDLEKTTIGEVAHHETALYKLDTNDSAFVQFSEVEQQKIMRRLDLRLVAMCGVGYCISLMDRTNLGAAAIAGWVRLYLNAQQRTERQQHDRRPEDYQRLWLRERYLLKMACTMLTGSSQSSPWSSSLHISSVSLHRQSCAAR